MRGTLPAAFIHDVALEMLLSLYINAVVELELESLVCDTTLPESTGRRWLSALVSENLMDIDKKRVKLSGYGSAQMTTMLTNMLQSQRELLGCANH